MAKLSSMQNRRLRSVAVAGLVVGVTSAFFPGGHNAHAASMMPQVSCGAGQYQPANIISNIAISAVGNGFNSGTTKTTGGTLTLGVGGGTVVFNGSTGLGNSTVSFSCRNNGNRFESGGSASGSLTFTNSASKATITCSDFDPSTLVVTNEALGSDSVSSSCVTSSGDQMTVSISVSATGTTLPTPPAATPELGSGELLATGLIPALGIVLYRRRRQRRAGK